MCLCAPAAASALTITFTGAVQMVSDDSGFLGGGVAPGAQVTGTYEVDPSNVVGASPFPVGPGRLAFQIGGYAFDATQDPHTIALIDNRILLPAMPPNPAVTVDLWQSGLIVDADLDPATNPGGSFVGYGAQIEFTDFDSTAFNGGETEPFVLADLTGWEDVSLWLHSVVASGGGAPEIDALVKVHIESWTLLPVPEPRSGLLLLIGLALVAARAR